MFSGSMDKISALTGGKDCHCLCGIVAYDACTSCVFAPAVDDIITPIIICIYQATSAPVKKAMLPWYNICNKLQLGFKPASKHQYKLRSGLDNGVETKNPTSQGSRYHPYEGKKWARDVCVWCTRTRMPHHPLGMGGSFGAAEKGLE
eukprot:13317398-Ditylum_brightwellii.AAC.1